RRRPLPLSLEQLESRLAPAGVGTPLLTATGITLPNSPVEGAAVNAPVAAFTDTDASAPSSSYQAVLTWGDGSTTTLTTTASAGGQIVSNGAGGYNVVLATYAEEGAFSVTISDGNSNTATAQSYAPLTGLVGWWRGAGNGLDSTANNPGVLSNVAFTA